MAITVYTVPPDKMIHKTEVDFAQRMIQRIINIVQYDRNIPIVEVGLYLNGKPYVIPNDTKIVAQIRWSKKDRTFTYKSVLGCNADRTSLYFDIDEQMSFYSGKLNPIIELSNESSVAGSQSIPVSIDSNPVQNGDIESSTSFKYVEEIAMQVEKLSNQANASATAAKTSETNAANSASTASTKAGEASASATAAKTSETNAKTSEGNSAYSASSSSTYANNALTSANAASNSATAAKTSETNAKNSETNAANSATSAKTSETNSKTSETNSKTSETNASNSASTASTKAGEASASATAAKTSETNSKISETNAANSFSAASIKASEASASATAAKTSETNASSYLSTTAARASEANASATAAKASEINAANYAANMNSVRFYNASVTASSTTFLAEIFLPAITAANIKAGDTATTVNGYLYRFGTTGSLVATLVKDLNGNTGATVLANGVGTFFIKNGRLMFRKPVNTANPFRINSEGHLIMTIAREV